MPRFYFHVHDGRDLLDTEEILKEDAKRVSWSGGWRVEVTDETGRTLFQMSFPVAGSSALRSEPG